MYSSNRGYTLWCVRLWTKLTVRSTHTLSASKPIFKQSLSLMHIPPLHTPPFITVYFFKQCEHEMIISRRLYTHSFLFPPTGALELIHSYLNSTRKPLKIQRLASHRRNTWQGCSLVKTPNTEALYALIVDLLMTNYPVSADDSVAG